MYPQLTESDLATAWNSAETHPEEIAQILKKIELVSGSSGGIGV